MYLLAVSFPITANAIMASQHQPRCWRTTALACDKIAKKRQHFGSNVLTVRDDGKLPSVKHRHYRTSCG